MKSIPIIAGLVVAAIVLYVLWSKRRAPKSGMDITRSSSTLPTQAVQNDKLIVIKGISYSDLRSVLMGFCQMYNKETFQALPRLTKLSEQEFAITFPYDVAFITFCYLINYLNYPVEVRWLADVGAWTTTGASDTRITEKAAHKKAMLFVSEADPEYDNVYITTIDNIGYKLGFAMGEEQQLLQAPRKFYVPPSIDLLELTNKEFEDFK